jgi:NTP pyrophosphatase (non-canonical NTP hydrolase)
MEEVGELAQAVNKRKSHKHVETELADVLYVVVGMAISLGINLEKAFDEVHAKNMLKAEAKMNGGE